LPGIVTAVLARSSSESDISETQMAVGSHMVDEELEISFENLKEFYYTAPPEIKDKKRCNNSKKNCKKQQKKKVEKGMKI
jgi:hypothetical protein